MLGSWVPLCLSSSKSTYLQICCLDLPNRATVGAPLASPAAASPVQAAIISCLYPCSSLLTGLHPDPLSGFSQDRTERSYWNVRSDLISPVVSPKLLEFQMKTHRQKNKKQLLLLFPVHSRTRPPPGPCTAVRSLGHCPPGSYVIHLHRELTFSKGVFSSLF